MVDHPGVWAIGDITDVRESKRADAARAHARVVASNIADIIAEAQSYAAQGVHGIDLLGYRYTGDAAQLNAELVKNVSIPVCIAGSVNSYQRLDELKAAQPWAFTIGSAFFDNQFSGSIAEQIDKVCAYMKA